MTLEQMKALPEDQQAELFENIDIARSKGKTTNFSAVYLIGAKSLARSLDISEQEAQKFLDSYWGKNWAVKAVAAEQRIKEVDGQKWLLNPISNIWYSLRYEKDVFSTLNQGLGDYIFNVWLGYAIKEGFVLTAQFHDECIGMCNEDEVELYRDILQRAIDKVNKVLKLPVPIRIDTKAGKNYFEVH